MANLLILSGVLVAGLIGAGVGIHLNARWQGTYRESNLLGDALIAIGAVLVFGSVIGVVILALRFLFGIEAAG